jgi:hypothetical protein
VVGAEQVALPAVSPIRMHDGGHRNALGDPEGLPTRVGMLVPPPPPLEIGGFPKAAGGTGPTRRLQQLGRKGEIFEPG